MKLTVLAFILVAVLVAVVMNTRWEPVGAPQAPPPTEASASTPAASPEAPAPPKAPTPCPVRLTQGRLTSENAVASEFSVTVTNVSHHPIAAVSMNLTHTDTFGNTREPYEGHLAAEEKLGVGRSATWQWTDLIVSKPVGTGAEAGHASTHITLWDLVYADGTRPDVSGCAFNF